MAKIKTSEPRNRAKPNALEELTRGIAKLRELSTHIDDLSRDGFPYGEAVRARTELSLRETIRRLFGEKSPEYQTHKNHKLRIGTRTESAQSTALLKELIAALEHQKADLLGLKPASPGTPKPLNIGPPSTTVPPQPASDSAPVETVRETPPTVPTTTPPLNQPIPPVPPPATPVPVALPPTQATVAPPPQPIRDTSMPRRPDPPSSPGPDNRQTEAASATAPLAETPSLRTVIPQETILPILQAVKQPAPSDPAAAPPKENQPSDGEAAGFVPPAPLPLRPLPLVPDLAQERPALAAEPSTTLPAPEISPMATKECDRPPSRIEPPVASVTQPPAGTEDATRDLLRKICTRFHLVARQLRLRKEYRPTLEINDEYDLQDLFYALLRLQFDEVGTEEWSPDYADGARRTTYLLDWDRTAVVVKQTRPGLTTKDLAEQVKLDAVHYSARPNGKTLLCFIYDPDGRIGNPRGLEADLTTVGDTYAVEVIVAPK
ncbi:MAG: hypothetical protein OJF52_000433 [Nitrospira sp.]|jgi:hypothetical protein|nr:MAG: hypothetical protein OJF52_000433 [Nitrospira sp.]